MLRLLLTCLPLAFRSILEWPLRAALTAFGILIGVAAVVITVALGEGTELAVRQKLTSMGENTLTVVPEQARASGATLVPVEPRLTESDGEAILRESSSVVAVAPLLISQEDVAFGGFDVSSQATGTTRSFFDIRVWALAKGELWPEQAESTASRVCLIGSQVAAELFGDDDPVGRVLRIGRHPFVVLGVLEKRGQGSFGQDQDTVVLMPIATKRSKLQPTSPGLVHRLLIKAKNENVALAARSDATAILRQRHGLGEGASDDFNVRSDDAFRETEQRVVSVLGLLLTSVAAISLLVGGIGIMNIMLVSVTERTRDIGIRMAIGATRWDILVQFLTESILLSLMGGALGAGLSALGTLALSQALSLPMQPSADALFLALGVSTGIGLIFGLVPAWRAASLDPIIALGRK